MQQKLVVRTGCIPCRVNGTRCNPMNPHCRQFSSEQWTSNSDTVQVGRKVDRTRSARGFSLHTVLACGWQGTARERQSLYFFNMITAPELAGYLDAQFWQVLLPQTTGIDAAIRHAVICLGAAHEHRLRKQASRNNLETNGLHLFATRQYNKAIDALVRPFYGSKRDEILRALVASVLFTCCENLNEHREAAVQHVNYAQRLATQYEQVIRPGNKLAHRSNLPVTFNLLQPVVEHYSLQVGDFIFDDELAEPRQHDFDIHAPLEFHSLAEARPCLEKGIALLGIVNWEFVNCGDDPDKIAIVQRRKAFFAKWLDRWNVAFSAYLARESSVTSKETQDGYRLLQMHQIAAKIWASVQYMQGDAAWANFTVEFASIVEIAGHILDSISTRRVTVEPPPFPYLSSHMGITEPLYCVIVRCASPAIVARARALVSKLPKSEGVYSSWKTAFIEKAMAAATRQPPGQEMVLMRSDSTDRSSSEV